MCERSSSKKNKLCVIFASSAIGKRHTLKTKYIMILSIHRSKKSVLEDTKIMSSAHISLFSIMNSFSDSKMISVRSTLNLDFNMFYIYSYLSKI